METHPFGNFVPSGAKYLFLGSFTGKLVEPGYDWFFGLKRNQFWPILRQVYGLPLETKEQKQFLFNKLNLAIADIILSCGRKNNSNLDMNLVNLVFNKPGILEILKNNDIQKIYFSSRFAENLFHKVFKSEIGKYSHIQLIVLPSPSPRYAAMSIKEKIAKYRNLLPRIEG